jgi:hypothetical protein
VRLALLVRIGFLLLSAVLLVAALQVRRDADAESSGPQGDRLTGMTGQRQTIAFGVDERGRPRFLTTRIWAQCPGTQEYATDWAPREGPVPFRWQGEWLFVRKDGSSTDVNGTRFASTTMTAHVRQGQVEGFVRAVWRFERDGRAYTACDSGYVPFAAGERAASRLARVARVRDPVTLYPTAPQARRPRSFGQRRFVLGVDQTCRRTDRELRETIRRASRRVRADWGAQPAYVRGHAAQLAALRALGRPPEAGAIYHRWLGNFDRRVELERRQLRLIRRGDFPAAASLAARISTLKANGDAAGIAFGLRACVSDGPAGAPNS